MKLVLAPDSFKESLSAFEVARAMQQGILNVDDSCEAVICPIADGGEGSISAILNSCEGEIINEKVTGPLGIAIDADYTYLRDKNTAVIETAKICGLPLIPLDKRDPSNTTSAGVGEMILKAVENGASNIIVCLGGSATNDGGIGMLNALGISVLNNKGESCICGKHLIDVSTIDMSTCKIDLNKVTIEAMCDVENPLIGAKGATHYFSHQKGANDEMMEALERGMINYSNVIKRCIGVDVAREPKLGAAGGIGAGLYIIGAKLQSGIDCLLKIVDFESKIAGADFVFTGEGSIDAQSKYGKAISGVAAIAKKHNIPVIAFAGKVADDINELYEIGITAVFSITDMPKSLSEALSNSYGSIVKICENVMRLIYINKMY